MKRTEMELGKLVQFERREKGSDSAKADRSEGAEIVMFTGVRYEREAPSAPTKPTASSGNKRKRG